MCVLRGLPNAAVQQLTFNLVDLLTRETQAAAHPSALPAGSEENSWGTPIHGRANGRLDGNSD
jgi:hypothetical protein